MLLNLQIIEICIKAILRLKTEHCKIDLQHSVNSLYKQVSELKLF